MTINSKQKTTIKGVVMGAFFSGVFSSLAWYYVAYRYPVYSPFVAHGLEVLISAAIGLVLGAVGGAITGLVVVRAPLGLLFSFLLGIFVNAIIPLAIFYGSSDGSTPPHDEQRWWNYSCIGQAIAGGLVGLLISVMSTRLARIEPPDLE